jgi:hypothetical protein
MISFIAPTRYIESAVSAGMAVKKGTAANGVTAITGTSDIPSGIVVEAAVAADYGANGNPHRAVVMAGKTEMLAGTAIAIDDIIVVDAAGKAAVKGGAGWVVGKALTPAANGEFFEILVNIRKEPA